MVLQKNPDNLFIDRFMDFSDSLLRQIDMVVNVSLQGLGLNSHCATFWLCVLGQFLKLLCFFNCFIYKMKVVMIIEFT